MAKEYKYLKGVIAISILTIFCGGLGFFAAPWLHGSRGTYAPGSEFPYQITGAATGIVAANVLIIMYWLLSGRKDPALRIYLYVFWTLGPPIWFFLEFFWLYNKYGPSGDEPKDALERFKTGQELAEKIWLAIAGLLTAEFIVSKK